MSGHDSIREHVHLHAPADDVYRQLSALHGHERWLPRAFRRFAASDDQLSFELALPLRRERTRLSVTIDEAPQLLVLERAPVSRQVTEQGTQDGAVDGVAADGAVDGTEQGAADGVVADGVGSLTSLSWALHREAAGEVHLTVEAAYRPAGGPLGALLESLLYRSLRRQAFRDALWRLKLLVERPRRDSA